MKHIQLFEQFVNEKVYQMTGSYGAKGIAGKVLFAFKKQIERIKYEGYEAATLEDINKVWSKWADKDGAKIIEQEVLKQIKDKDAVVYITATLAGKEWIADDVNGINAKFVDIFLSTNGGTSFDIMLASKVPNDGSETITVPNMVGTSNRIMVKGWDNIFFDVSNTNFSITAPASTMSIAFNGVEGEQNKSICQGSSISYPIAYKALGGFGGTTTFSATGNTSVTTVTFNPTAISTDGEVTMTISNTIGITPGLYNVIVTATSGAVTKTAPFYLDLLDANFASTTLTSPANNAVKNIAFGKVFSVSLVSSAKELKESNPVKEKQSKVAPVINAPTVVISFQNGSRLQS